MSLVNKPKTVEAEDVRIHRIRITLSSRNVKNLEKGASLSSVEWCVLRARWLTRCDNDDRPQCARTSSAEPWTRT